MAAQNIKVPIIDDVTEDEQFIAYLNYWRKLLNYLAYQMALAAAQTKAMLRVHDKRARERRAHKVARPLALAAGLFVAASKLLAMAAKRFQVEYAREIEAGRRPKRHPGAGTRNIRFGNGAGVR